MEGYQHQPRPTLSKTVTAFVVAGVPGLGLGGYTLTNITTTGQTQTSTNAYIQVLRHIW